MEITSQGKVVKGLGGLYEVCIRQAGGGADRLFCRAKGIFRHHDEKVLIGDNVSVQYDPDNPDQTPVIRDILPRKNALIRPPIANLDYLYCLIAAAKPKPVLETLDKLLAISVHNRIRPIVVVTKADFGEELTAQYVNLYRDAGFEAYAVSSTAGDGLTALRSCVARTVRNGASAAFAGCSGVGKSSLLNALFPGLSLATNTVSRKTERGRHTTRSVELFSVVPEAATDAGQSETTAPAEAGYIADTPGFSLLDFARFDFFGLDDLFDSFPDYAPYAGKCRYADCTHTGEGPGECAIARAVQEGQIAKSRHDSYVTIYRALKDKTAYR